MILIAFILGVHAMMLLALLAIHCYLTKDMSEEELESFYKEVADAEINRLQNKTPFDL